MSSPTCQFIPVRMRDIDSSGGDLLILSLFQEDRPPIGLTGLVDWRLDGLISRLRVATIHPDRDNPYYRGLVLGPFHAEANEKLLFPAHGLLPFFHVLVFGLGAKRQYDSQRYRDTVREMLRSAASLGAKRMTLQLPGWMAAGLPARRACDIFFTEHAALKKQGMIPPGNICLVEDLEHQAEMDEKLSEILPKS